MARLGEWKRSEYLDRLRGGEQPAGEGAGGFLTLSDGVEMFYQAWLPEGKPGRVIVCLHGLASHGFHYALVADAAVVDGAALYAPDHRGHGLSGGPRACIAPRKRVLRDIDEFLGFVREQHPGAPVFLLGESMGGLFAINYCGEYAPEIAGLVLKSVPLSSGLKLDLQHALKMPYYVFCLLSDPDRPVIDTSTEKSKVFKNPLHLKYDENDEFKSKCCSTGMLVRLKRFQDYARETAPEKIVVPTFVLYGGKDFSLVPVATHRFFKRLAAEDRRIVCFPEGYHAMFSDPDCQELIPGIVEWTSERA